MPKSQMTTASLIKAEIDRLHKRASADHHTLLRQVEGTFRPVRYNLAQMIAAHAIERAKWSFLEWSRGTGKSDFIAYYLNAVQKDMPRSTGMMIGPTYQKMLTETLPSTQLGLERIGIFKDLHYFIGRRAPKSWKWPHAYQPPDKYDRYISFWTGSGIHLVSQDVTGGGRGLNADYEVSDESALLDPEKMQANTGPALRGSNKYEFSKSKFFVSRLHASSTPLTLNGRWFTSMEEKAYLNPDRIKFLRADCRVNLHNLADNYLEDAKASALNVTIYKAEYLNIRPSMVVDGFYNLLDENKHAYNNYNYTHYHGLGVSIDSRGDADVIASKPLTLGVDWGSVINCLTVCQHVGRDFRALKSMYALGSDNETQTDLFKKFADYYQHHKTKHIYLWYDKTGNVKIGAVKGTRASLAKKYLESRGWTVQLMTRGGRNAILEDRFDLWQLILKEEDPRYPRFRINMSNARELWISMSFAKTKFSAKGQLTKDKRSEQSSKVLRQHATDLSDAIDAPVYGMFAPILYSLGRSLPETTITSI